MNDKTKSHDESQDNSTTPTTVREMRDWAYADRKEYRDRTLSQNANILEQVVWHAKQALGDIREVIQASIVFQEQKDQARNKDSLFRTVGPEFLRDVFYLKWTHERLMSLVDPEDESSVPFTETELQYWPHKRTLLAGRPNISALGATCDLANLVTKTIDKCHFDSKTFSSYEITSELSGSLRTIVEHALTIVYENIPNDLREREAFATLTADLMTDLMIEHLEAEENLEQASAEESAEDTSSNQYRFRKSGDMWDIRFGDEHGHFAHKKGFDIIARLLRQPNPAKPPLAMDLQGQDPGKADVEHTDQETLDRDAINSYGSRLDDIEDDIREATKNNDQARLSDLKEQKQSILDQLQKDVGLGGRARSLGPDSPHEQARKAVRGNLGTAYKALRDADPPLPRLVEHLKTAIRAEGITYAYRCEAPPDWQFD